MGRVRRHVDEPVAQVELAPGEPRRLGPEDEAERAAAGERLGLRREPARRPRARDFAPGRAHHGDARRHRVEQRPRAPRPVQHVPGAVGERRGPRPRPSPAADRRGTAPAAPCSSWRGRRRPRWRAGSAARGRSRRATGPRRCESSSPGPRSGLAIMPDEPPRRASPPVRLLRPLPRPAARACLGARPRRLGRADGRPRPARLVLLAGGPGRRPRPVRLLGPVARDLLPRRQDRLLGRPDDADRDGLRDPRGRPAADGPPRLHVVRPAGEPRHAWTGPSTSAPSRSRSTRARGRPRSAAPSRAGASTSSSAPPRASAGRRGSSPSRPRSP